MGKNHLLNYIVAGIIAVYSIPVLAQNELEVTSESDGEQIVTFTDKGSLSRHGNSERYTWKPSSSSSSRYNSEGKAVEISHIKSIRRKVEPTIYDVTNPETSEINVMSIEKDGTMSIEASEEKAPKVGDIICSGPTELAPYGYLLRVTEVNKRSEVRSTRSWREDLKLWKFVLKTTTAAFNEVLSNFHYAKHINFDDIQIDQLTDSEGNNLQIIEEKPKEWKVPMKLDLGPNLTIKPEIIIKPKDLFLYVDVKDKEFQKFGADFDMDVDVSLQIDVKLDSKFEKSFSLFYIFLKPIPICAEPPIVLTPLFQVYLTFKADGQIKLSCVPVNNTYRIQAGAYYDFIQKKIIPNVDGDYYNITLEKEGVKNMNSVEGGITFNGSVSAALGASLSLGIDGCNYVGRVNFIPEKMSFLADMVSVDFWYDLVMSLSAKLGIDNINTEVWNDYHIYDQCKSENTFKDHLQFFLRIWNPFKGQFVGFEPKIDDIGSHFWEDDLYPSLFVPDYQDLTAKPKNGAVMLHVKKYRPYFWNILFKEQGYGFRYAKFIDKDTKMTNWKNVPASNVIGNENDPLWFFDGMIPMDDLEKGSRYFVCPYSYVLTPAGSYTYLHRDGLYFRVNDNGTISFNELPNIPGFDL